MTAIAVAAALRRSGLGCARAGDSGRNIARSRPNQGISALTRGRLAGFPLDRLVRFLVLLGSVQIVVKAARDGSPRKRGIGGNVNCT